MSRDGFASEPAQRHHRMVVAVVLAAMFAASALTYGDAMKPIGHVAAFLPLIGAVLVLGTGITAYLILVHSRVAGRAGLPWLAGAYLFASAITIAQISTIPGGWSPIGHEQADLQTDQWLWAFWHFGFATLVIASQIAAIWQLRRSAGRPVRRRPAKTVLIVAIVLALAIEAILFATRWQASLPPFAGLSATAGLWASVPAWTCVLLTAGALISVGLVTGGRTVLDLGLVVAVAAALADTVLTLRGGAAFSLGWYAGRCAAAVAGLALLAAYLHEIAWLHGRVLRLGDRLAEQAAVDAVTGLSNRRHLNRQLELALRDARRRGEDVSLLLLDIDHFNAYSTRYGHLAGEDCLRRIGQALASAARRPQDVIARYGSEEYAVLLPSTGIDGALHVASLILEAIHGLGIEHAANPPLGIVTLSAGAATVAPGGRMDDLLRRADRALHAAKEAGRNRVVSQGPALA